MHSNGGGQHADEDNKSRDEGGRQHDLTLDSIELSSITYSGISEDLSSWDRDDDVVKESNIERMFTNLISSADANDKDPPALDISATADESPPVQREIEAKNVAVGSPTDGAQLDPLAWLVSSLSQCFCGDSAVTTHTIEITEEGNGKKVAKVWNVTEEGEAAEEHHSIMWTINKVVEEQHTVPRVSVAKEKDKMET